MRKAPSKLEAVMVLSNPESILSTLNLRPPGAVLLISCYELGHQPLGVASAAGFLEGAGYAPEALDVAVEPFDAAKAARARFVGLSVPMHTALRLGVRVAERVRELNPTCHICFYGLYAWMNAEYLLRRHADSVIGGEFEEPLLALVQELEGGTNGGVAGVSMRGRPAPPHLKRLPFAEPSRRTLPALDRYARLDSDGELRVAGYVEATRGCAHLCMHCPIPPVYGGRFFVVPQKVVLADIRRLVEAGARHVTFGDPDFLNGPGHSLRILRAMHEEFPSLSYDFTAKVEHVLEHRGLFPELARLGCIFMISAVESLSDVVLANLAKGHTRAAAHEALGVVRGAGISFRPTWVPFTPWTAARDYLDILDFVETEGLIDHVDAVQYGIRLLVPPGSLLLDRPEMRPFLTSLDEASLSHGWTHPDPWMDRLQRDIAMLVARDAGDGEDAAVTFQRVRALAERELLGREREAGPPSLPRDRRRPPRLTESWFC